MMRGDDVALLQTRLMEMGFDLGRIDGIFGPRSAAALSAFQKSSGLNGDGSCGPETLLALHRLQRTVTGGLSQGLRESAAIRRHGPALSGKRIVIDPGHGGDDIGVSAFDLKESDIVLDIASRIEGRLGALGVAVYLTRGAQSAPIDDGKRAEFANQSGADLFVSLHLDANSSSDARGVATYYYGNDAHGAHSVVGERLASLIQREVAARTDLLDCRVHAKTWELLRHTRMPAVRVELGYLTNPGDATRLRDGDFREVLSESVAVAIQRLYLPDEGEGDTGVLRLSDLRGKM
jgi:N-acetylmuramoyl-L-alanine amidase